MAEHVVGALQGRVTKASFSLAVTGELGSEELKKIMHGLSYREDEAASKIQSINFLDEDSSDGYSENTSDDDCKNDEVNGGHEEDNLGANSRDSDNEGAVSDLSNLSVGLD